MSTSRVQALHRATRIVMAQAPMRTFTEADERLRALRLQLVVGPSANESSALQAAALTVVNAGKRTFLGGVHCIGASGAPVVTQLATQSRLSDALQSAGGQLAERFVPDVPSILIGADAPVPRSSSVAVRVEVEGWKTAVSPAGEPSALRAGAQLPIAGVFGAALALSEIFGAQMQLHAEAGRRQLGFSLWHPDPSDDWKTSTPGPALEYLPRSLWIVGLGHLGQGYLWSLASLPYLEPGSVEVMLQDGETIAEENLSTCLLTEAHSLGRLKTRVASQWLEARGFRTRMLERRFAMSEEILSDDPRLVLAGVDSPQSRLRLAAATAALDASIQVLDVGLGATTLDFDELVLHASPFPAADIRRWTAADARQAARAKVDAASKELVAIGAANDLDSCGVAHLAGLAVGVPYVGAAAGALALAEVLRRLVGATPTRALSLRLRDLTLGLPPIVAARPAIPIDFVRTG